MGAIKQVLRAGTDRQMSQASAVMAETRRSLYRILADDAPDPEGHADAGPSDATE
jgi:hypothetical protein